jgi:uncharacterized protein YcbK (DUF882 family)
MKVTSDFDDAEFAQKARHGLPAAAYPLLWIPERLLPLCNEMQVLRAFLGRPIRVISGYRSEAYNRREGGARFSQHVQGRAADIVISGFKASEVHEACLDLIAEGRMKLGGLGAYPNFTHLDVRPSRRLIRWTGARAAPAP